MPQIYYPITIVFRGTEEVELAGKIRVLCGKKKMTETLKKVIIHWYEGEIADKKINSPLDKS